jgi:hypothetical protein
MLLRWNDVYIPHLLQKSLDGAAHARTQIHDDTTGFPFLQTMENRLMV